MNNLPKQNRDVLRCPGTLPRRAFLHHGVAGAAGLTLAGLLRTEAIAGSGSQVVGSTNSKGDEPHTRPLVPNDLLATWYRYLGIPVETHVNDFAGRPTPIVPQGRPIEELV